MDWPTALVAVAFLYMVALVARAFFWSRAEVQQTAMEVGKECGDLNDRLYVLEGDVQVLMADYGPEVVH